MSEIVTLERLQLPQHLNGSTGSNRAKGRNTFDAVDDLAAVRVWLDRFTQSETTFAGYRREAERLLLWCVEQQHVALSALEWDDFLAYQKFLANPQPARIWVMPKGQKPIRSSPAWRPFAGPLSAQSINQAMYSLKSLFNWLVDVGYLMRNPLAPYRPKVSGLPTRVDQIFPQAYWTEVRRTIDLMPATQQREATYAARARWLFSLLYLGGLRVSEVCSSVMGGFSFRGQNGQKERWWLAVTGNGGKTRQVPVSEELITELIRYRRAVRLPPLPTVLDQTPLLLPLVGAIKPLTPTAVHDTLRSVLKATAARLRAIDDNAGPAMASEIERASTHWIRKTEGAPVTEDRRLLAA